MSTDAAIAIATQPVPPVDTPGEGVADPLAYDPQLCRARAWLAESAEGPLVQRALRLPPLGAGELDIEVTHCGLCHSDLHLLDDAWSNTKYPLVPGHEIVGTIRALGSDLRAPSAGGRWQVGMRVGVGWQRGACGHCDACARDEANLCSRLLATCADGIGGFASHVRIDHRYVFEIPDELASSDAAPLLCGGATVFAPLERFVARGARSVAVVGIGGLGHLAIAFARAMNCRVAAISSSPDKRAACLALGCSEFVEREDAAQLRKLRGQFDLVLVTAAGATDARLELSLLRRGGQMCILGAAAGRIELMSGVLVAKQLAVSGSFIAPPATIQRTLTFAAEHEIAPIVSALPFEAINRGIARARADRPCARIVFEHQGRESRSVGRDHAAQQARIESVETPACESAARPGQPED